MVCQLWGVIAMQAVEYINKESLIHKLNPLTKMFWIITILSLSIVFNDIKHLLLILFSVVLVAAFGKILENIIKIFSGLLIIALIIFTLQIVFYQNGLPVLTIGFLKITKEGITLGINTSLRMMIIFLSFVVFLGTTQTRDFVITLVDKLHVPHEYAYMFMIALRFIPTFIKEVALISQAQLSRGYQLEGWNPLKKITGFMPVAIPLVINSLKKAEKLALAMEVRGFNTNVKRTYYNPVMISKKDIAVSALLFVFTAFIFIFKCIKQL
jgi:energy-coupling factor transport system permease protein